MEAFNSFIGRIQAEILNPIITLIALASFVVFVWGVAQFIMGAAEPEKRQTGQQHMIWGIIGLVVVFGAQVIVTIMKNIVGVE